MLSTLPVQVHVKLQLSRARRNHASSNQENLATYLPRASPLLSRLQRIVQESQHVSKP